MTSQVVLRAENLGKRYRLGTFSRRTFLSDLSRKLRGQEPDESEFFWALRDVGFELRAGEVLGILGRNGAGKSTLLKLVSSIMNPTTGRILLRGRVASLLEVGTGFHNELTGRENVYLNGTILGMSHAEVKSRFDEIVEFSGVENFIDTPVKRYSSGMRVRLAFAVAAHLQGEILIIDEVLAVGDQTFQNKCLGKVGDVAKSGRTVLFVSHNASVVQSLCTRGIVLQKGKLAFDGTQDEAIHYYANCDRDYTVSLRERENRKGSGKLRVVGIEFRNPNGTPMAVTGTGTPLEIWFHFENPSGQSFPHAVAAMHVQTTNEVPVFYQQNRLTGNEFGALPEKGAFVCFLPRLPLVPGAYMISFTITANTSGGEVLDSVHNAAEWVVEGGDFYGTGILPPSRVGNFVVDARWRLETNEALPATSR